MILIDPCSSLWTVLDTLDYVYILCTLLAASANLSYAFGSVTSFHLFLPWKMPLKCLLLHLRLGTVGDQKEEGQRGKVRGKDKRSFRKSSLK